MKARITKRITLALAIILTLGMFSCGVGEGEGKKDNTKTYLSVYNFDGGIGTEWAYNAAKRFEELYKDVSFEDGKVGVKVEVFPGKSAVDNVLTQPYDVFFSESVFYNDLIAQGSLLDISDIITSPLNDIAGCNETGTIKDKLFEEHSSAIPALNGKYYVLPHYECYSGVSYDRDLFDKKSLFIKEGTGNTQFTNLSGDLSVGPDGVRGSYDDGLPSSYEEFYALLDRMAKREIEPFIYSGAYYNYTNHLISGLWASYAGKDEFMLNVNFDSNATGKEIKANIITGFDKLGNPIESQEVITPENGYLMSQQSGKYYALNFFETIMKTLDNFSSRITKTSSHLDAQADYVFSSLDGDAPIAMIIEGSYWYNEAKDALNTSANAFPEDGVNRDFSFMPLPRKLTGQVQEGEGTKNTLLDTLNSYCFIKASVTEDPAVEKLAKTFLKFCYTDSELMNFTQTTSVFKGVKYNVNKSEFSNLSKYASHLYDIRMNSDVIHPYSDSQIFINAQTKFNFSGLSTIWESGTYKYPISSFKDGGSAKDYFQGMWVSQNDWEDSYGRYFEK